MYTAYRIQPDYMENRKRYYYYESSDDFEPLWLKYVCLFSMVVLFIVILV